MKTLKFLLALSLLATLSCTTEELDTESDVIPVEEPLSTGGEDETGNSDGKD